MTTENKVPMVLIPAEEAEENAKRVYAILRELTDLRRVSSTTHQRLEFLELEMTNLLMDDPKFYERLYGE